MRDEKYTDKLRHVINRSPYLLALILNNLGKRNERWNVCVCVCVCVRERERDWQLRLSFISDHTESKYKQRVGKQMGMRWGLKTSVKTGEDEQRKRGCGEAGWKGVCMFWLCVCSPECSYGAEVTKNAALWAFGWSHIVQGFLVPRCQVVDKSNPQRHVFPLLRVKYHPNIHYLSKGICSQCALSWTRYTEVLPGLQTVSPNEHSLLQTDITCVWGRVAAQ